MRWPQQALLKAALGISLKESQFLSPAKQELILTGILCNSREPGDWEKQGWGEKYHRMKVEVEWKSRATQSSLRSGGRPSTPPALSSSLEILSRGAQVPSGS